MKSTEQIDRLRKALKLCGCAHCLAQIEILNWVEDKDCLASRDIDLYIEQELSINN